jgi:hypothetical protein
MIERLEVRQFLFEWSPKAVEALKKPDISRKVKLGFKDGNFLLNSLMHIPCARSEAFEDIEWLFCLVHDLLHARSRQREPKSGAMTFAAALGPDPPAVKLNDAFACG